MSVLELLSFDNLVFETYVFWSAVLVLKMLLMGPLTGIQRFKTKTFANPEDLLSKKDKVKFDDPDVERVRRAHRNDMENIFTFFVIGFLYIFTNPPVFLAINLFRAFAIARIVHTVVYAIYVIPQPSRAIAYFVGLSATAYMALHVFIYTLF